MIMEGTKAKRWISIRLLPATFTAVPLSSSAMKFYHTTAALVSETMSMTSRKSPFSFPTAMSLSMRPRELPYLTGTTSSPQT